MPLTLPNLDDRSYTDLVAETVALIPTYAPEWTNHNPSDPGITLIELFAHLTEILLYRQNRVTRQNVEMFLRLLNGPNWQPGTNLQEDIRSTVLRMRQRDRAVTCEDFEALTIAVDPEIARAHCLSRRNLELEDALDRATDRPGHISVMILPNSEDRTPQPNPALIQAVKDDLEPRRLLTTRVHVVGPRYLPIAVRFTLMLKRDALEVKTREAAIAALEQFFHPLRGGPEGTGWIFGRNVYTSELYQLLDNVPGVDYVTRTNDQSEVIVLDDVSDRLVQQNEELIAVTVHPEELIEFRAEASDLRLESPIRL